MIATDPSKLNGLEKASVLLMALGTSASAEVFKHLSEDEIERLSAEIVRMRKAPPEVVESVMTEFERMSAVARVVASAPDPPPAAPPKAGKRPLESLAQADPGEIARMLGGEQPQIIAVALTHLPRDRAAEVLARFDHEAQSGIARCICEMDEVAPEVAEAIEDALHTKLSPSGRDSGPAGTETLVEILNNADSAAGDGILDALGRESRTLADEVRAKMFVFDDLMRLDDRSVEALLRQLGNDDLAPALKGADEEIKELVFRNMSERSAEALKDVLELSGPVKVKVIEAAQRRIAAVARHLIARGEIFVNDAVEETSLKLRLPREKVA